MRTGHSFTVVPATVFLIFSCYVGSAFGQSEFELMVKEEEFVESAIKARVRAEEVPSSVFIFPEDMIKTFGFYSVGDMLNWVPGMWGIYNYTMYNFGLRGIHGGPKAGSRILKTMLDSSDSIVFRPSGELLLGSEFIPLSMVEAVEVVKGPASALYGANAFMGVVNVKTKRADIMDRLFFQIAPSLFIGERKQNLGIFGEVSGSVVSSFGAVEVPSAFGIRVWRLRRDGLRFSPESIGFSEDPSVTNSKAITLNREKYLDRFSEDDDVTSLSALAKTGFRYGNLDVEIRGIFQGFSSSAQFLEYGMLNPANRMSILNTASFGKISYQLDVDDITIVPSLSVGYLYSAPSTRGFPSEEIVLLRPDRKVIEGGSFLSVFGSSAIDGRAEVLVQKGKNILLFGADFSDDKEELPRTYQELPTRLVEVGKVEEPVVIFRNTGFYAQTYFFPIENVGGWRDFSILGVGGLIGVRYDDHNIYEDVFNVRVGFVLLPLRGSELLTYVKGIYGTSFRAPSPEQLFSVPQMSGDFMGNPKLRPEKARTAEIILGADVKEHRFGLELKPEFSAFIVDVKDAIRFIREGSYIRASNIMSQRSVGTEMGLGLRYQRAVEAFLSYSLSNLTVNDEEFGEEKKYDDDFFPRHLVSGYFITRFRRIGPMSELSFGILTKYVGRRSVSTTVYKYYTGFAYPEDESKFYLPSYLALGLSVRAVTLEVLGYSTSLLFRVDNIQSIFSKKLMFYEPGFWGLDIPGGVPFIFLSIEQTF